MNYNTAVQEIDVYPNKVESSECSHYWLIETPNGPLSRGVCRFCGAERDFNNSVQYTKRLRDMRFRLRRQMVGAGASY